MGAARKVEVISVEDDVRKKEVVPEALEIRVVRLEGHGERTSADMAEIKVDLKDLRTQIQELRTRMEDGFQSIRKEISDAKIWALLIAAAMLGVLARGFHWM
jgi:hypothetical protein